MYNNHHSFSLYNISRIIDVYVKIKAIVFGALDIYIFANQLKEGFLCDIREGNCKQCCLIILLVYIRKNYGREVAPAIQIKSVIFLQDDLKLTFPLFRGRTSGFRGVCYRQNSEKKFSPFMYA